MSVLWNQSVVFGRWEAMALHSPKPPLILVRDCFNRTWTFLSSLLSFRAKTSHSRPSVMKPTANYFPICIIRIVSQGYFDLQIVVSNIQMCCKLMPCSLNKPLVQVQTPSLYFGMFCSYSPRDFDSKIIYFPPKFVFAYMYMYVDICVHVNIEARGQPWVLPQELSILILFESRFIKA